MIQDEVTCLTLDDIKMLNGETILFTGQTLQGMIALTSYRLILLNNNANYDPNIKTYTSTATVTTESITNTTTTLPTPFTTTAPIPIPLPSSTGTTNVTNNDDTLVTNGRCHNDMNGTYSRCGDETIAHQANGHIDEEDEEEKEEDEGDEKRIKDDERGKVKEIEDQVQDLEQNQSELDKKANCEDDEKENEVQVKEEEENEKEKDSLKPTINHPLSDVVDASIVSQKIDPIESKMENVSNEPEVKSNCTNGLASVTWVKNGETSCSKIELNHSSEIKNQSSNDDIFNNRYNRISLPIGIIDCVEIRDGVTLHFLTKFVKCYTCDFASSDGAASWMKKVTDAISYASKLDHLFCFRYWNATIAIPNHNSNGQIANGGGGMSNGSSCKQQLNCQKQINSITNGVEQCENLTKDPVDQVDSMVSAVIQSVISNLAIEPEGKFI